MPPVAKTAATQRRRVQRFETVLRLVSPLLDAVLGAADRLSRVFDAEDPDYVPARMTGTGESAPRGLTRYPEPPRA